MTEADWLACEDHEAMLEQVTAELPMVWTRPASDRKLWLFVVACRKLAGLEGSAELAEEWTALGDGYAMRATLKFWSGSATPRALAPGVRCALLRDIIGNPFRPVTSTRAFGGLM